MLDVHCIAAFGASRRIVDQVERGCAACAFRADEVRPAAAFGEPCMACADELRCPIGERDDGLTLGWIDRPHGAEARHAHTRELIEEAAIVCVCAALAHGFAR